MTINIFMYIYIGENAHWDIYAPPWKTITQKKNQFFFIIFLYFRCILLQISHKKCFFISISILRRSGVKQKSHSHLRVHNDDERPYECTVCGKCFKRKDHLASHMRVVHSDDPPYICTVCDKCFAWKSHLTNHMRIHRGERTYKCNICDRSFKQRNHLTCHLPVHSGARPYKCTVCYKRFAYKISLTSHMREHNSK